MSPKTKNILLFCIALLCSIWAFLFLPHYAHISERDDVWVAGMLVIPALIVSIILGIRIIKNKSWKLALGINILNSFSAFLAIDLTQTAILEVLTLENRLYDGKAQYSSLDVFAIGILPAVLIFISWSAFIYYLTRLKQPG